MSLKPIAPQTLAGLKKNTAAYETASALLQANANVVAHLSPGDPVSASSFSVSPALSVTSTNGTFKRGNVTVVTGRGAQPNPSLTLRFPSGLFTEQPFATVVRNGGNGALPFTYSETAQTLVITIQGTPVFGNSYTFQWLMRD